jgi:hypothetical protein
MPNQFSRDISKRDVSRDTCQDRLEKKLSRDHFGMWNACKKIFFEYFLKCDKGTRENGRQTFFVVP